MVNLYSNRKIEMKEGKYILRKLDEGSLPNQNRGCRANFVLANLHTRKKM